ncbi:MAG: nitric oxide synthase oxygenase, partial [Ktedonobacteraceae bacterium]|nr:nitric oxide synthase oxygenase [Ktedonobacteraceae bacterium]
MVSKEWGSMEIVARLTGLRQRFDHDVYEKAEDYIRLFSQECNLLAPLSLRLRVIRGAIARTGSYWHTYDELAYGAKVAWRNSTRCIGRLHWHSLIVRDLRHLSSAEDIFDALVEHIRLATNSGKIRSMISVFA